MGVGAGGSTGDVELRNTLTLFFGEPTRYRCFDDEDVMHEPTFQTFQTDLALMENRVETGLLLEAKNQNLWRTAANRKELAIRAKQVEADARWWLYKILEDPPNERRVRQRVTRGAAVSIQPPTLPEADDDSETSGASEASEDSDESDASDDEPRVFERPEEPDDFQRDPKLVDLEKVEVIVKLVLTPALTRKLLNMGRRAFTLPPLPQGDFRERALALKKVVERM